MDHPFEPPQYYKQDLYDLRRDYHDTYQKMKRLEKEWDTLRNVLLAEQEKNQALQARITAYEERHRLQARDLQWSYLRSQDLEKENWALRQRLNQHQNTTRTSQMSEASSRVTAQPKRTCDSRTGRVANQGSPQQRVPVEKQDKYQRTAWILVYLEEKDWESMKKQWSSNVEVDTEIPLDAVQLYNSRIAPTYYTKYIVEGTKQIAIPVLRPGDTLGKPFQEAYSKDDKVLCISRNAFVKIECFSATIKCEGVQGFLGKPEQLQNDTLRENLPSTLFKDVRRTKGMSILWKSHTAKSPGALHVVYGGEDIVFSLATHGWDSGLHWVFPREVAWFIRNDNMVISPEMQKNEGHLLLAALPFPREWACPEMIGRRLVHKLFNSGNPPLEATQTFNGQPLLSDEAKSFLFGSESGTLKLMPRPAWVIDPQLEHKTWVAAKEKALQMREQRKDVEHYADWGKRFKSCIAALEHNDEDSGRTMWEMPSGESYMAPKTKLVFLGMGEKTDYHLRFRVSVHLDRPIQTL